MLCPICKNTNFVKRGPLAPRYPEDPGELPFDLWECQECEIVRVDFLADEKELLSFRERFNDMLVGKMEEKDRGKALRFFEHRARKFDGLQPGRLLDIGSERGYFLKVMKDRGWRVEGLEPFPEFVNYAKETFDVLVHPKKLEDFSSEGSYDLITLWHVLEHLEDPSEALRQCRLFLAEGGLLHFEIPNIDSLGVRLGGKFWMGFRDPTHAWLLRKKSMEPLARSAGFNVIRVESGYSPSAWYSLKRALFGRLFDREHWRVKKVGHKTPPGPLQYLLYGVFGFYPILKSVSGVAGLLNWGEALNVWLQKKTSA